MELGIPSSTYRAVFQLVLAESRKRRRSVSSIRRTHPRAALSKEAIRVGSYGDRARARHSTSARDCACVGTRDGSTNSRRHLSATYVTLRVPCAKFSALQCVVEVEVASLMFLSRGLCLIACKCESQIENDY